jgi:hypothetical protein
LEEAGRYVRPIFDVTTLKIEREEVKESVPLAVTPKPAPSGASLSLTGLVRSLIGQVARVAWG